MVSFLARFIRLMNVLFIKSFHFDTRWLSRPFSAFKAIRSYKLALMIDSSPQNDTSLLVLVKIVKSYLVTQPFEGFTRKILLILYNIYK